MCILHKTDVTIDKESLLHVLYERVPIVKSSLEPQLWGYHTRITVDDLTRYMQHQEAKFPVLEEFLKNVRNLCVYFLCICLLYSCP